MYYYDSENSENTDSRSVSDEGDFYEDHGGVDYGYDYGSDGGEEDDDGNAEGDADYDNDGSDRESSHNTPYNPLLEGAAERVRICCHIGPRARDECDH